MQRHVGVGKSQILASANICQVAEACRGRHIAEEEKHHIIALVENVEAAGHSSKSRLCQCNRARQAAAQLCRVPHGQTGA